MRIKVDHIAANARHKFQFPEMNNNVKPDTLLSSGVGAGTLRVNSRHHQGIKALEKNLRVNAILTLSSMHALITVSRSEEKNPSGSGKSPLPEYCVLPR